MTKGGGIEHTEEAAETPAQLRGDKDVDVNARLENPLAGISYERLQELGRNYARNHGLEEFEDEFARGAAVAQDPLAFESIDFLTDRDREVLRREVTHKWDQPKAL